MSDEIKGNIDFHKEKNPDRYKVSDLLKGSKRLEDESYEDYNTVMKMVEDLVGLRPGRMEVRLEREEKNGKYLIHNYGHGGSGVTLSWGCADEVVELANGR